MRPFLCVNVINSLYLQNVFVQKMKITINIKNLSNLKKNAIFYGNKKTNSRKKRK
jgi:hypothetical protein